MPKVSRTAAPSAHVIVPDDGDMGMLHCGQSRQSMSSSRSRLHAVLAAHIHSGERIPRLRGIR
jgi:hypothetical protein